MSEILVVGSLAYDSISTPSGKVDRALGGSANYFSLAASLFSKVRVVGVVGEDYEQKDYELLNGRGVDLTGLSKVPGKTFHWAGSYEGDMNEAKTLNTELNVFEHFNPQLPEHYKDSSFVFLANIAPELQLQVLSQVKAPKFVGLDTMNLWINIKKDVLLDVVKKVDLVLINEGEAKMLTGAGNAIAAAPMITAMGPSAVVIKRGEYGFAMYTKAEGYFILPAMPIPSVIDPTGAGDTFAGGFFGYLAAQKEVPTVNNLKQACIMGSMMASHTIQDFSVKALAKVTLGDLEKRLAEYKKVITL
ncbi:PfkB family carbohydrate kinase [Bdellovibrio sp. NC01]|uniref:PfkB family carbohydrate kinase n=1 Tax=Bdellovibrio sp. NC01 TaxID=2220073 RepID=UPI00115C0062|nr:PfkB family carbohydrate kinase [Bdellovibrio sp. NC01]QDK36748.1 sugar kinase [Bdellovibrio sp. NC01]